MVENISTLLLWPIEIVPTQWGQSLHKVALDFGMLASFSMSFLFLRNEYLRVSSNWTCEVTFFAENLEFGMMILKPYFHLGWCRIEAEVYLFWKIFCHVRLYLTLHLLDTPEQMSFKQILEIVKANCCNKQDNFI